MRDIFPKKFMNYCAALEVDQKPFPMLNSRKLDRLPGVTGIYVLMSWKEVNDHILMGELIDINAEGCGISYVADRYACAAHHLQNTCRLRIIGAFKMVEIKKNAIVYDKELTAYSTDQISARRCGIKFGTGKLS
jgi:hypothetical protein